jgi:hypothetical protein
LWRFWYLRGHGVEGNSWFEAFISLAGEDQPGAPTGVPAKLYQSAGKLAAIQGEPGRATELIAEGLRRFQEVGDRRGIADMISIQEMLAQHNADHDCALALFEERLVPE